MTPPHKPIVGGESCQKAHLGIVTAGRIRITPDDGDPIEFGEGDIYVLAPGHHAEVTSDEPFVCSEFEQEAAETYAQAS